MKSQVYKLDSVTRKPVPIQLSPERLAAVRKSFKERFTPDYTLRAVLAMRVEAALKSVLRRGGILTMPGGYRVVLADVHYNGHMLWWFEAFGREHLLQADGMEHDGPWIKMMSGQTAIATIGPIEGEDDSEIWAAWKAFLESDEGRAVAASIADLKALAESARQ